MHSVLEFMEKNDLNDENLGTVYADKSLPRGSKERYSIRKGLIYNKKNGTYPLGVTSSKAKRFFFFGKQRFDVYLSQTAFSSPELLYLVIGHELIHVYLYAKGLTDIQLHERTAYRWTIKQCETWRLNEWAGKYTEFMNENYDIRSHYNYSLPLIQNRPKK